MKIRCIKSKYVLEDRNPFYHTHQAISPGAELVTYLVLSPEGTHEQSALIRDLNNSELEWFNVWNSGFHIRLKKSDKDDIALLLLKYR